MHANRGATRCGLQPLPLLRKAQKDAEAVVLKMVSPCQVCRWIGECVPGAASNPRGNGTRAAFRRISGPQIVGVMTSRPIGFNPRVPLPVPSSGLPLRGPPLALAGPSTRRPPPAPRSLALRMADCWLRQGHGRAWKQPESLIVRMLCKTGCGVRPGNPLWH